MLARGTLPFGPMGFFSMGIVGPMSNIKKLFLFAAGFRKLKPSDQNNDFAMLTADIQPIFRNVGLHYTDRQICAPLDLTIQFIQNHRSNGAQINTDAQNLIDKINNLRQALIQEKNAGTISSRRAYQAACATYAYIICIDRSSDLNNRNEVENLFSTTINPLIVTSPLFRGIFGGVAVAALMLFPFPLVIILTSATVSLTPLLFGSAAMGILTGVVSAFCTKEKVAEKEINDIVTDTNVFRKIM